MTPVSRFEFLYGKQIPYIVLAMVNFFFLTAFGMFAFRVPFTGDFLTFALAALLYVTVATGIGLLISAFMRSQVAAIFATTVVTMIPAVHFSGLIDPRLDNRRRPPDRRSVPDVVLHHDCAWHVYEGARLRRSAKRAHSSRDHGPDIAYRRRAGAEKAGQLRCASPTSCSSESRNCAASDAITSWFS